MEKIFSAHLDIDGKNYEYHVVFENEKYIFSTDEPNATVPTFSFTREENEWIAQEDIDPGLKKQAVGQLESYLLSQH
jgi:hypothetical protein